MKPRMFRIFLSLILLGTFASFAVAEVIELEGTIKAIDAKSRTVTIERKTPKGVKTLDLEVNKKAGDLSVVNVGDTISFSYHPDLEIVTKIQEAKGSDSPRKKAKDEPDAPTVLRITYTFGEDGSTKTACRRIDVGEGDDGTPRKTEKRPGIWRVTHVFDDASSIKSLQGPLSGLSGITFDEKRKALLFDPHTTDDKTAQMQYPERFRLPLTVEMDVVAVGGRAGLQIAPNVLTVQNVHPFVTIHTHDGYRTVDVFDRWVVGRGGESGKPQFKEVASKKDAPTQRPLALSGVAPVRHGGDNFCSLRIGVFAGDDGANEGILVRRMSVEARLVPTLGLGLKQDGDSVVVQNVAPKSLAERAGFEVGDRVMTIEGKEPSDLQRAIQLLGMTNYGESWTLEIERDEEKKAFTIKAE